MGTLGNPKLWPVPYINPKDCSPGFCSLSCPQWCYLIFPPPPPPFTFPIDSSSSSPTSSLVISIIGVLASALLLVSCYAILSKYCGNSESSRSVENREPTLDDDEVDDDDDGNPSEHEAWVVSTRGLDEALIKSITLVKFKRGDGLVGSSSDCSVCLGEFQEDESLRLLPKCSHAFHVECIDTWLKSRSNCPLCRASIFSTATQSPPQSPRQPPLPQHDESSSQTQVANEENRSVDEEEAKSPLQAFSDLGIHGGVEGPTIRRSISMDHFHETRVSIPEIWIFDSKVGAAGESSKPTNRDCGGSSEDEINRNGFLNCVVSSVAMKRSFSSGRFFFSKHGRGRNAIIPL